MISNSQLTGQQKFDHFRSEFPYMSYDGFDASVDHEGLKVIFHFDLAGKYSFNPSFLLPLKLFMKHRNEEAFLLSPGIQSLLFHIGMIELISYWKVACAPIIKVRDYALDPQQVKFWKKVYFHGLGEFFYLNGIQADRDTFVSIQCGRQQLLKNDFELGDTVLVPIGGGKDSIVTLELLRKEFEVRPFILNPRGASLETCFKAGFSNTQVAEVNRKLDPLLLKLNDEGFLNGHTPFSAMLAFYTLLVSAFTGNKYIALSNESSANEPTVAGTEVNHQYSKSYGFESDFRTYVANYISGDFNYFSFLRPLSELQIGMLFSKNVKYYPVFKSCNVGSKTDSWCGSCPKCLFAWIILSPFIPINELVLVFGKNMYEDPTLLPFLKELTGIDEVKPFECVGTIDEVNAALQLFIKQHNREKWPLLIDYYSNTTNFSTYQSVQVDEILKNLEPHHYLDDRFLEIIKQALSW
jgi:UDP-N-acetyl-alpha-D-muramoyl-L-alanyl-L-glutamate epimerase